MPLTHTITKIRIEFSVTLQFTSSPAMLYFADLQSLHNHPLPRSHKMPPPYATTKILIRWFCPHSNSHHSQPCIMWQVHNLSTIIRCHGNNKCLAFTPQPKYSSSFLPRTQFLSSPAMPDLASPQVFHNHHLQQDHEHLYFYATTKIFIGFSVHDPPPPSSPAMHYRARSQSLHNHPVARGHNIRHNDNTHRGFCSHLNTYHFQP